MRTWQGTGELEMQYYAQWKHFEILGLKITIKTFHSSLKRPAVIKKKNKKKFTPNFRSQIEVVNG